MKPLNCCLETEVAQRRVLQWRTDLSFHTQAHTQTLSQSIYFTVAHLMAHSSTLTSGIQLSMDYSMLPPYHQTSTRASAPS